MLLATTLIIFILIPGILISILVNKSITARKKLKISILILVATPAIIILIGKFLAHNRSSVRIKVIKNGRSTNLEEFKNVKIELLDKSLHVIAEAKTSTNRDFRPTLSGSESDNVSNWASKVRYARLVGEDCIIDKAPVTTYKSDSLVYTWWIPVPHNSLPSTTYYTNILLPLDSCSL